jgi:hypothetical protein
MRAWVALLLAVSVLVTATVALGHARSASYSSWWLEGDGARVRARISSLDLNVLEKSGVDRDSLARHVPRVLTISSDAGPCTPVEPARESEAPAAVELEWRVRCPSHRGLRVRSDLLVDLNPTHLHFASVHRGEGAPVEGVLDAHDRVLELPAPQAESAATPGFIRFVQLGIEHIAGGWDHLVFVLMLVLAGGSLRRTALTVSGFTVGHSITLTLATLGAVVPDTAPVEALIGLSIAILAVENVWLRTERRSWVTPTVAVAAAALVAVAARSMHRPGALAFAGVAAFSGCYFALLDRSPRPERLRALVAGLFGLVHGFGFARVLQEMQLPTRQLARDLVGFNLGVELGQLGFIALAGAVLALLAKRPGWRIPAVAVLSAAGVALGCYWFVVRALA